MGLLVGEDTEYVLPVALPKGRGYKKIISANGFLGERMSIFGLCLSGNPKYVFRIGTILKADFRSLDTYFGFWCPYILVGDGLTHSKLH